MARPHTWLSRLPQIYDEVQASTAPAWSASMLQYLFHIGLRPAKTLLRMMPLHVQGRCMVVTQEDLLEFLAALIDAESPSDELRRRRSSAPAQSRHLVRVLDAEDFGVEAPAEIEHAPEVRFDRGYFAFRFRSRAECEVLIRHIESMLIRSDFERLFCPSGTKKQCRLS